MKSIRKKIVSVLYPLTKSSKNKDQKIKKAKYMKEEYRKKRKYLNCVLNIEEYKKIKEKSKIHWKTPTEFLRESAVAYLNKKYLLPENTSTQLEKLIFIMRNIANNLNQIAKHTNTQRKIWILNMFKVQSLVAWLERKIKKFISNPTEYNDY